MTNARRLSRERVAELSAGECMPELILLDETTSTNTVAKQLAEEQAIPECGIIIAAERQTAGRGRLGRSFLSDGRGLYFSYLFNPKIPVEKIVRLTAYAAVAMARAVDSVAGVRTGIKWVNDLYLGGKKLAGILTEGVFSPEGELKYAVVGIGVNLYHDALPDELASIATSIEAEAGEAPDKSLLLARFIDEFSKGSILADGVIREYRERSVLIGKRALIERINEQISVTVLDITDEGALLVKLDTGEVRELSTGEISVRLFDN